VLGSTSDTVSAPNDLIVADDLTVGDTTSLNRAEVTGRLFLPYLTPGIQGEFHLCINGMAMVYRCGSFIPSSIAQPLSNPSELADVNSIPSTQPTLLTLNWQAQIAAQAEQIKQQQAQIEALKQTVCAISPAAQICGK
jgi:hypothetical protein